MQIEHSVDEYIDAVEHLAAKKSDFTFRSSNSLTATVIISKIMEHADKEAKIYDHCLDGDVADQHEIFEKTLKMFFSKGKTLKIIIRSEEEYNSAIYDSLAIFSEFYPNQVHVRLANNNFRENLKNIVAKDVNFCVNDTNAYRLETNAFDATRSREALCNFNNKEISEALTTIFDKAFDSCKNHKLPDLSY